MRQRGSSAFWVLTIAIVVGSAAIYFATRTRADADGRNLVACVSSPSTVGGRVLVANQRAGSASIFDVSTGVVKHVTLGGEPHGVATSPDGRWGVVADYGRRKTANAPPGGNFDGNRLFVLEMSSGRIVRTIETGEHRALHDIAFAPGSSRRIYVTAQRAREVLEIDILDSTLVRSISTNGDGSHTLAVSPDGMRLLTANEESDDLSELDLSSGHFARRFAVPASPLGLAFTPTGSEVVVGEMGGLRILDAATYDVRDAIPGIPLPDDIAVTGDGKLAVVSGGDDGLFVIDLVNRRIQKTLGFTAHAAAIADDNRTAFVTMGKTHQLAIVDLQQGCVVSRVPVQQTPDKVSWSR